MPAERPTVIPPTSSVESSPVTPEAAVSNPTLRQQYALGQGALETTASGTPEQQVAELGEELSLTQSLLERGHASLKAAHEYLEAAGLLISNSNRLPVAPSNQFLSTQEVVDRFRNVGAVKEVASFADQLNDDSRDTPFRYVGPVVDPELDREIHTTTEAEGLHELNDFLTAYRERATNKKKRDTVSPLVGIAESMQENLTFIGEDEHQEGAEGFHQKWGAYLKENPDNQLCILTGITQLERYKDVQKSDTALRDEILSKFSDEEAELLGRISTDLDNFDASSDKARVVMLDDRAFSGTQLRDSYGQLMKNPKFAEYAAAGRVEINLLVSSETRIRDGMNMDPYDDTSNLPVKAYFVSRQSLGSTSEHAGHVTSVRSSGNYDFAIPLKKMARHMNIQPPSLARIFPAYKDRLPEITANGVAIKRAPSDTGVENE